MHTQAMAVRPRTAALLVGTLCAVHIISQFLRTSVGVIAPDLAIELGLDAAGIGLLSSAFFLSFAAVQIPLGIGIDRFGARRVLLFSLTVTVAGIVLFAMAPTAELLLAARVLLGLGCSSFFMGPLAVYARWFPPERFSSIVGIQLGLSSLGMLAATAPLAFATAAIGWRASFLIVAAIAGLVALLVFWIVSDDPPGRSTPPHAETWRETLWGLVRVARTPSFVSLFALQFASYSVLVTVLGLWGGPYLAHVYGFGVERRGTFLLVLAVASVVGNFIWGPMDRFFLSYKRPALVGSGITTALLAWLAVVGHPTEATLLVWFALFGLAAGYVPVITAHGRSLFPPHLLGRGLTLLNLGTMSGVFVLQILTGAVVNQFPAAAGVYPLDAYRAAFAVEAATLFVAVLIYARARDTAPNREP